MKCMRQFLALVLSLSLLVTAIGNTGLAEAVGASRNANASEAAPSTDVISALLPTAGNEPATWADGAKLLCGLLGYLPDDGADIDLTAYADAIVGLSTENDSLYLAILAANGYLDGVAKPIDPNAALAEADYEGLVASVFPTGVFSQGDADELLVTSDIQNLVVSGDDISLSSIAADRVAVGPSGNLTLTACKAAALSVAGAAKLYLSGMELARTYIGAGPDDSVYLHVDDETEIPEIAIAGAGDVTVEGDGALGVVRVLGKIGSLTVRATCSVVNETENDLTVTGPDGEAHVLAPGDQVDLILMSYLVNFVSKGTPVESQTLAPGAAVDFGEVFTEKEGAIFTAWYEDAGYSKPHSTFDAVEGQLTLYARFIDEADAVTVTFETFGGREVAPLTFARGENLLCKPASQIYTSKEGYTFGGWCRDEACTIPFGYTDPIEGSMTLHALFTSNEPQEAEEDSTAAALTDFDWQGEIPLAVPAGMTLSDVEANVSVAAGAGAFEPVLSFRETDAGYAVYGAYYVDGDASGFEPGATFTITASGGVGFVGYGAAVHTLVVAVYRPEVEVVAFAEDLTYINWSHVTSYDPVVQAEVEDGEGTAEPGTVVLDSATSLKPGDIAVFYDGDIGAKEMSITDWTEGSFDGYVMFAQVLDAAGETITFGYASPVDYLSDLDVHVNRDVEIDDVLDEEQIGRLEQDIASQIVKNDELKAQMLIAVMTSPDTQEKLDAMYGAGVYALAEISASVELKKPSVKLTVKDSTATATISISATIELKNGKDVVMTITPTLSFTQETSLETTINGGKVWVDVAATIKSKSTIKLEVTASSGEEEDMKILGEAKDTLEKLVTPDGLDDSVDYEKSVNDLMTTMQSLVATALPYNDLFVVPLFNVTFTFYGIVSLTVKLDLVGQIGVLATFGVEIIATNGQRVGFNYNFLKLKGGSYSEKLPSDVVNQIYLIGKLGVRLGLRLTVTITVCLIAKATIVGNIFAYAELTGMFFYTASLVSGSSSSVGALNFEVGIDASVSLTLSVNLLFKTVKKSWTVWKDRFPLFTKTASTTLSLMDLEKLDQMWAASTLNADQKTAFGFAQVPMKTYTFLNGNALQNALLWDGQGGTTSLTLAIENLVVDGETIPEGDPRGAILAVGDGTGGRSPGMVYLDEGVAAEYQLEQADCDVVITYQNSAASALVKKQSHTFHLSRKCTIATTSVNVRILLYDWCAHTWGIEAADWDDAVFYETRFESSHAVGGLCAPTETGEIDLAAIRQSAVSSYAELEGLPLSWFSPTRNGTGQAVQYSVPRISNFCYMTPENGTVRYDVHAETYEYTLTWYLYASRFPGYSGEVNYVVNLIDAPDAEYAFSVAGGDAMPMAFTSDPSAVDRWTLSAPRAAFDGTDRPLMMTVNGGVPVNTGFTINGREPDETVTFDIDRTGCALTVTLGEGVAGYVFVSPEIASGDEILPGTEVTLSAKTATDYKNVELVSEPAGLSYKRANGRIVFTMPACDVRVTLVAYHVSKVEYMYNYGEMGLYKTAAVAANETISKPVSPAVKGLRFRGWYETADCAGDVYAFGGKVKKDLVLYADWTCDITVDFGDARGQAAYLDGEGLPALIFEGDETEYARFTYSTLRAGDPLLDIVLPNYSGYDFMGWYLDSDYTGEPVDIESYALEGGVTLYARWAKVLSITYDWNDGATGAYYQTIEDLGFAMTDVPPNPARDYYAFGGWYTSPACGAEESFDPATDLPTGDLTLYARWTADSFGITYDLAGGVNASLNPASYTVESGDIALAAPIRAGYDFAGWTGTELAGPTRAVTVPAGAHIDRTYTATWTPVTYAITYDLVRGTVDPVNPESYTIESAEITLNNPTMDRYTFMGWIGTGLTEPTMMVTIPAGSLSDRSYTATWQTDDPASKIADDAIACVSGMYTLAPAELPDASGVNSILYTHVRETIDADPDCGPYADHIELTIQPSGAPGENAYSYIYTFAVTIAYTDDAGTTITRDKTVTFYVAKLAPTVAVLPTAGDLTYGQSLASSSLTGGCMTHDGQTVEGTFSWVSDTTVPLGKDNGRDMYGVFFMPADTATYGCMTVMVAVNTQIGVQVTIAADSRDYVAGSTATNGTYALSDIDTGDVLSDISLTGGSYVFPQVTPGDNLTVTFSGYALSTLAGDENLYSLRNSTATASASIDWITPTLTAPTAAITYGDVLRDVGLVGGSAMYGENSVPGAWAWTQPNHQVDVIGTASFSATFTPTDTAGYRSCTADVTVDVKKQAVALPTIAAKTYTGALQTADVDSTSDYTVTANEGGTDAGTYDVVLTLTDPTYYRWENDPTGTSATATLGFVIEPATLTVTGTASVIPLGYGQKLAAGTSDNGTQEISANTMISGVTVQFGATTVTGNWTWVLTGLSQPLDASDPDDANTSGSGHTVSAAFSATSVSANNFKALSQSFTVVVKRATPDVSGCGLTASPIIEITPAQNSLGTSNLSAASLPKNPASGADVAGTWAWEDAERIPEVADQSYNVVFTPASMANYTTTLSSVTVPFRNYINVTMTYDEMVPGDVGRIYNREGNLCQTSTWRNAPDTSIKFTLNLEPAIYDSVSYPVHLEHLTLHGNNRVAEVEFDNDSNPVHWSPEGEILMMRTDSVFRFISATRAFTDVSIELKFAIDLMHPITLTAITDLSSVEQASPEPTESVTPTPETTEQPGETAVPTGSVTPTPEATEQPSETVVPTENVTPTLEATEQPGETAEPAESEAPTPEATEQPRETAESPESEAPTQEATGQPGETAEPAESETPTPEATGQPGETAEPTERETPTTEATGQPGETAEPTASEAPSPEATEQLAQTVEPAGSVTSTPEATEAVEQTPESTPTGAATTEPSSAPTGAQDEGE